jgi:hypothetical protein
MIEHQLMPKNADVARMASETFLSDLSRKLLTALGDQPPKENIRDEKIMA